MSAWRVINAVPAATTGSTLKAGELRDQLRVVEELHLAAIQGREQVAVEIGLRFGRGLVIDPVLSKRLARPKGGLRRFRNVLLDLGFEMSQFSVYLRFCSGKEQAERLTRKIEQQVPKSGKVHILYFTDKQYENVVSFRGQAREASWKNPAQFTLF
jgi:CRISPR-associated protein Cas2